MSNNLTTKYKIIQPITNIIVPYIFLYAIYIQLHGEISPGGGFQAGVIFASAIIIFDLVYGYQKTIAVFRLNILLNFSVLGVAIYGGVGIISMIFGGNFLDYSILMKDPIHGQHIGIMLIELGVGLTVSSVMALLYLLLRSETINSEGQQ